MLKFFLYLILFVYTCFFLSCRQAETYSISAIDLLNLGNKLEALKLLDKSLVLEPENSIALYGKGKILLDHSVTAYIGVEMLHESLPGLKNNVYKNDVLYLLAKYYKNRKEYNKSLDYLLQCEGTEERCLLLEADVYLELGRYAKAISFLKEVYKKTSLIAFKLKEASIYIIYKKNYKLAIPIYEKLLEKDNKSDYIHTLIDLYYIQGNHKKVLEHFTNLKKYYYHLWSIDIWKEIEASIENRTYEPQLIF